MSQKIYLKTVIKDTSENWSKFTGVLPNGVIAYESDTNKMKLGDGINKIGDLPHMIGDSASATIYKFKGSVASKKDLPSTTENGDVYNVEDTGSNYAFTGSSWDKLSENIDLKPYLTKEEAESIFYQKQAWIDSTLGIKSAEENAVKNALVGTISGEESTFSSAINKLDNAIVNNTTTLDQKANKTELPTKTSELTNDSGFITEIPSEYITETELNEKGYLTEHQDISGKADKVDLETKTNNIDTNSIITRLCELENKLSELKQGSMEEAEVVDGAITISSGTEDVKSVGSSLSANSSINANSVSLDNVSITSSSSQPATLNVSVNKDVELKNVSLSGEFIKSNSNAIVNVVKSDYVTIKDSSFNVSKSYNAIEIGSQSAPRGVLIDNVTFEGNFDNNAISIFETKDNSVININNCSFEDVSNILRLSNKNGAKNVVINITNCSCDKWADGDYRGMILLQDYTSKSLEEAKTNNLFGSDKMTINISNFYYQGKKLTQTDIEDVLYLYRDAEKVVRRYSDENKEYLPTINIM